MNSFVYDIPTKVYFGREQLSHLGEELKRFGSRVLLAYGGGSIKRMGLYDAVVAEIEKAGLELFELSGIEPNPRIESVRTGAEMCKEHKIDVILAVGGGSTIDAAKFIAAGACVEHDPWDFLSEKWAPIREALPIVTVLTLSATGSEMDTAAVITNFATQQKKGRLNRHLLPRVSFLDPTNTFTVSPYQTACGSADIISHILEVYFAPKSDMFMLDCFMEGLLKTVIKYAPVAMREPDNYEARANLMWASSWAINGFITAGKAHAWSCHPIEHELSAFYDITHGLGLAIVTPRWMEYCLEEGNVDRYVQFAENVFGVAPSEDKMAVAKRGIELMADFFFKSLGLDDNFTKIGIRPEDFPAMAKAACGGGVIPGFKPLAQTDIERIYQMCVE